MYKKAFYLSSAYASGLCLIFMTLLILAQIIARMFGQIIPSSEDFAGWLLSASIFFGLAYTFSVGGHIRVTILLSRLPSHIRFYNEVFNLVVGLLIAGFLSYYSIFTVYESYDFHDVTDTYLAVPLWIIQIPMALGSLFLFIALVDSLFCILTKKTPSYMQHEDELSVEKLHDAN